MRSIHLKLHCASFIIKLTSIVGLCVLSGCTGIKHYPTNKQTQQQYSQLVSTARNFEQLAHETKDRSEKNNLLLDAAKHYAKANLVNKAQELLDMLPKKLTLTQDHRKNIILAQLALKNENVHMAEHYLGKVWGQAQLSQELKKELFLTKAYVYEFKNDYLEAAIELVQANNFIDNNFEKNLNNKRIFDNLNNLTPKLLTEGISTHTDNPIVTGWLEFVKINKNYDYGNEQVIRGLAIWLKKYPSHPARDFMPDSNDNTYTDANDNALENKLVANQESLKAINNNQQGMPTKIGLILPLSGQYATSAKAVRDGFLAAYYEDKKTKPKVQIYDSNNHSDVLKTYEKAIQEGADFIVGPLMKQDLDRIYSAGQKVKTLALNDSNDSYNNNIFQFGLSPEAEATATAKKIWRDGKRNVVIIYTKNQWGERVKNSFKDYFTDLGGKIVTSIAVDGDNTKISEDIKAALHLTNSENRVKNLKNIGVTAASIPQRRKDLDAIFMATNPETARQVKPLLNYHYANDLPTYATSSIYTGKAAPDRDQDLNGIKFCDMPWVLDEAITAKSTYKKVSQLWPQEFSKYIRLYALGLDAYKISIHLHNMQKNSSLGISGMTGMLYLKDENKIQRMFMWAEFKNGHARYTTVKETTPEEN